LRCGLDFDGAWIGSRCSELLRTDYSPLDYTKGKPLPFDLARAHALYKALFGQIEDLMKDRRLLIVPSGALTQLPFQVLVTERPKSAVPSVVADYRDVAWLTHSHAITILPAVASLKSLRELARQSRANDVFIGFGDPLLDGDPMRFPDVTERARLAREKRCGPTSRDHVAGMMGLRGSQRVIEVGPSAFSDVAMIRHQMPLPETADELCGVAQDLGVDPVSHVYLGANATETTVKRLSSDGTLAQHKIVHFATHGTLAGQLSSKAEPGLLLTPPEKPNEIDDGYLTASEVATLKLDADWVILSACNTAAGEAKDAEALSGLARAFFYAGARSLLVSHWSVASDSTVKLIANAVAALRVDPKIGRAEALRRSMLSLMQTGQDIEAHPSFWAPFVLVGEGGPVR
jgi:CHAT domain-containing protein